MFWRPSREPDVLDEVGRVREAYLAGPMVEDLRPRRARARSGRGRRRGRRAGCRRGRTARRPSGRWRWRARRRRAGRGPGRRWRRAAGRPRARRRRISGPRTSMPGSARIRFASSTMRSMSSSDRTVRRGRTGASSPRVPHRGPQSRTMRPRWLLGGLRAQRRARAIPRRVTASRTTPLTTNQKLTGGSLSSGTMTFIPRSPAINEPGSRRTVARARTFITSFVRCAVRVM